MRTKYSISTAVAYCIRSISFCVLLVILSTCTKADIDYRPEPQSLLLIHPDVSIHTLPAMQYHFYNADEQTDCLILSCDGKGNFSGTIPPGDYRVIAVNTDANGVQFTGMDNCEAATVSNSSLTRSSYTMLSQPDKVYSIPLDWFTISGTDTVYHYPTPVLLTKKVWIKITLTGTLQEDVIGIEGILPGVYSEVNLYSCKPTETGMASSPNQAVKFEFREQEDNWLTDVNLFGLCNPDHGLVYENNMDLFLTMSDQFVSEVEVELTEQLSEIIEKSQGVIPIELSLHIKIDRVRTKLIATVVAWRAGGSGSGYL